LIPFLTKLDIRRQHEGWATATYVTINNVKYDLTTHFAQLTETNLTTFVEPRWTSATVDIDKHTVGNTTYNARLLAMVILNSITNAFMTTLIHRNPTILCNDGTFLLWSVCHNIHQNNVAFQEHIHHKIRSTTLADHGGDVDQYIIAMKNHLKMITPLNDTAHNENGLITYILCQLKMCSVPLFQDYIRKLHVAFQEGDHSDLTPTSLLTTVENKIRALKHAHEWNHQDQSTSPAMALTGSTTQPSALEVLLQQQTTLLGKILEKQTKQHSSYHEWKHSAPANLTDIRRHNGKIFRWCTKCNNGQGQWASAHDTKTHVDSFRHNKGKSNEHNRSQNSNGPKHGAAMATTGNQGKHTTPDSATAYDLDNLPSTSALASRVCFAQDMENAWRFDVSDAIDE
jgi:hypothetical protein